MERAARGKLPGKPAVSNSLWESLHDQVRTATGTEWICGIPRAGPSAFQLCIPKGKLNNSHPLTAFLGFDLSLCSFQPSPAVFTTQTCCFSEFSLSLVPSTCEMTQVRTENIGHILQPYREQHILQKIIHLSVPAFSFLPICSSPFSLFEAQLGIWKRLSSEQGLAQLIILAQEYHWFVLFQFVPLVWITLCHLCSSDSFPTAS